MGDDQVTKTPEHVATYVYRNEVGKPVYEVRRFEPGKDGKDKSFEQWRRAKGGAIAGLGNVKKIPYRLPELLRTKKKTVYLVEGEKDADTLADRGI
jgi:putative DNA primase/helicase